MGSTKRNKTCGHAAELLEGSVGLGDQVVGCTTLGSFVVWRVDGCQLAFRCPFFSLLLPTPSPPCLRPSVAPLPFYRLRSRAQDRPEKAWVGDRERGRLAGWLGLAGLVGSHLLCVAALSHNNSRSTTTHYTKGEGVHGIARCDRASWGHWEYGWRAFGTATTSVVYLLPGTRKNKRNKKKDGARVSKGQVRREGHCTCR